MRGFPDVGLSSQRKIVQRRKTMDAEIQRGTAETWLLY